jgi:putative membrane protein
METEKSSDSTTRLAEDRTVLANERTYTAWVRTGIAALASGVAVETVLSGGRGGWAFSAISVILLLFSLCAFFLGIWHYTHLGLEFRRADVRFLPLKSLIVLTAALCASSILALIGLFVI